MVVEEEHPSPELPSHCGEKDASWTHLYYVVADDGGTSFDTSSVRYLNSMPSLPTNVQVLVLIDRCNSPVTSITTTAGTVKDTCAQLYRVLGDGRIELLDRSPHKMDWRDASSGDVSMCDPATLAGFVEFGMKYTNSTNYSLIVAGHGDGDSVGYDSTNDSALNPIELGAALDQALRGVNDVCHPKLDLVVMAACAMATAGTYVALAPYADHLIASQENIYGYDFHWMGTSGPEVDAGLISVEAITRALEAARVEGGDGVGQQVTWRLDAAAAEELQTLVRELSSELGQLGLDQDDLEDERFNQRGYDLRSVAERIEQPAFSEALEALLQKVVLSKTELSSSNVERLEGCGMSGTSSGLSLGGTSIF